MRLWHRASARRQRIRLIVGPQRIAATLASLGRLHGVREEEGSTLRLRLSQDDLGAMLGVSRQSVSKELRVLEKAGVVGADYSRITIHDVNALNALAGRTDSFPAPF